MPIPAAVFFDLGIVLSAPDGIFSRHSARLGVTEAALLAEFWTDRDAYDRGLPLEEYWGRLQRRLGVTGVDCAELAAADSAAWAQIRPAAAKLVAEVAATGVLTGLLSNAPTNMADAIAATDWVKNLDHVLISALLGCAKPDPEIYILAEERCGYSGSQIAFIDDREENVQAALDRGWQAHLWVSDVDSRNWLVATGVLS